MNTTDPWLNPDWPAPTNVHAATTLRYGGLSQGVFTSLNLAKHVGDDPVAVEQNRAFIKQALELPSEPCWLRQTHSAIVVKADDYQLDSHADASFTDMPGVVCAVMTADCLPVLLCSADGQKIAAVHAGWRGLVNGVIDNTVHALAEDNLMAWLGPAIGPNNFEVGEDVVVAYLARSQDYQIGFKSIRGGKWLADIYALAKINLGHLGITQVYGGGFCTFEDSERFYSYRRDKDAGRMATLIWRD